MTALKRCLGVDLGTSAVKVVEVAREREAVRVLKCGLRELHLPPTAPAEERAEAMAAAVREIIREQKMTSRQGVFAVPGQAVFVKRVRLPRTTEERLHRIINYEARQQIPFPLDKTLLEFQIFDEPDDPQVEVLLVAIKRDFIDTFMRVVAKTRVKPVLISVSSLALFNFHLFDTAADTLLGLTKPKAAAKAKGRRGPALSFKLPLGKKKAAPPPAPEPVPPEGEAPEGQPEDELALAEVDLGVEDVRAFLNIGASTLDIVIGRFGQRKTLGFTRSVPIAGHEITRLVMDRLGLESFEQAEALKREKVAVVTEDQDLEAVAPNANPEASSAATMLVNRLVAEIRRTLDFFVSQPDGVTVDSIVLSGGSARLANLASYVEEKVGLPVEVKDAPQTERLLCDGPPPEGWGVFYPALGLGLTGLGLGKVDIDFLPTNLKDLREFKGKWAEIAVLAGCLVVSIGFGVQVGQADIGEYERRIADMEDQLNRARPNIEVGDRAVREREQIKSQFDDLAKLLAWRPYWATVLRDVILQWKPPQIYLTRVDLSGYGQIQVRGIAHDDNAIAQYEANISENCGELVQTDSLSIRTQPLGATATGQRQIGFEIFMLAQSKRTSATVPYRELRPPAMIAAEQQRLQQRQFAAPPMRGAAPQPPPAEAGNLEF